MREKPIVCNTWEVQAILDGKKTQMRRVIKPQPTDKKLLDFIREGSDKAKLLIMAAVPYRPGDILWVRETWDYVDFGGDGEPVYEYKASPEQWIGRNEGETWHNSIHMPRAAARIFLRVTDVRVERVQDINEIDLIAEGVEDIRLEGSPNYRTYEEYEMACILATLFERFIPLWNSLNAKRGYGWDINPWVWVYTFERMGAE